MTAIAIKAIETKKTGATRERLLETAIQLIWQSSYASVGVNEICEKAGITKGAFYHYFDSKAMLFEEATSYYWEQMKHEVDAIFSPQHGPLEQLEGLLSYLLSKQQKHALDENPVSGCPFFTSGAQCSGAGDEKIRIAAMEMSARALRYNTALVKNLMQENMLEKPCDPQQTAELMYQFIQGLLLYGRVFRDLAIVERNVREGIYRLLALKPEYRR